MEKSLIFVLGIVFVLLVSGCTQTGNVVETDVPDKPPEKACPETCGDNDPCTADFCDENTGFECLNVAGSGMRCGEDGICNKGVCEETKDNCTALYTESDRLYTCYSKTYFRYAINDIAPAWCEQIKSERFRRDCYSILATEIGDVSLCDDAPTQSERDYCYFSFAEFESDERFEFSKPICDRIFNVSLKEECMSFESFVSEVIEISDFFIDWKKVNKKNKLVSYMMVEDRGGESSSVGGTMEVVIEQYQVGDRYDDVVLYNKTYRIEPDDFKVETIDFMVTDLIYVFPPLGYDDLIQYPNEKTGRILVTFDTDEGNRLYAYDKIQLVPSD